MNMIGLLQELRQRGISISLQGEQLKIAAPPGALTPQLRDHLVAHKPALIQWLREQNAAEESELPLCQPDPEHLYQPFPLNDLQQGFIMADDPYMEFHVRPHYYNEIDAVDFDLARYEQAWKKALLRHRAEIVVVTADRQLQTVDQALSLPCKVNDLRTASHDEVQLSLAATRAEMMRSELPLDSWPWMDFRATLWTENDGQGIKQHTRLHLNFNNFFTDGYGATRLMQEVQLYYREPDAELPALSLSYRDSVLALEAIGNSPVGKAAQRYWEERLAFLPEPPSLPLRTNLNRRCRSCLQRRQGYLPAEAWSQFKTQAAQFGITPTNAILAVYMEIVGAWANSRHFVLSNMMTRRLNIHPEMRDILGNFASLYPLEFDLRTDATFVDRARKVQEQVINDAKRLQWGGMQVMQAWNRRKQVFGVATVPFVVGSGLFMENFRKSDFACLETSQVMLDHQFNELDDGRYWYVWDVLEEFFLPGVLDHMQESYNTLLQRLINEPHLWRTKVFDVIPEEQLTARNNVTPLATVLPDLCLDDFLREAAERVPQNTAVKVGDQSLSYAALQTTAASLAKRLQEAVPAIRGRNVVIVAQRGVVLVQAVHAVILAGAAYVPVDPALPQERQHYIIENSEAAVVLVPHAHIDQFAGLTVCTVLQIEEQEEAQEKRSEAGKQVARLTLPADLAYLIYTSGSTGRPKGVMIEHQAAVNTILDINQRFDVTEQDRIFGISSFGFDLSVYDLFGSVAAGATLVYPDPTQTLNPSHWLDVVAGEKISVWNSAPPLAFLLVETAEHRGTILPDLRLVMMSGDWIPIDLPERIKKIAPNAKVVSLGGATEASIWSICYEIDQIDPEWQSIPYGYPMTNQSWHVLDAWGRPAPDWVIGELYIGGDGLARGYWNDPEKTAAGFIAHPITGERIYRTGDMGRYRPGGVIEFMGRRDLQVKIQGHRIELGEIESVLTADSGVSAAVVVVRGSNAMQAHLMAYVVPRTDAILEKDRLQQLLEQKLPAYMVPRSIHFLEKLPLSSNGKVDRKALPEMEEQSAVAHSITRREPADVLETSILAIWRHALNQSELGVSDDFFDAGGQSFEAVRIVGAIREAHGVTLSLGAIWQQRTVEKVAAVLRTGQHVGHKNSMVPIHAGIAGNDHAALYLVHPAGGHIMCYRNLAALLKRPVFGFQAPGVDGDQEPLASIEEMATHYVGELVRHQPEGLISLGGWSSGALIAFEMAWQLQQNGRQVRDIVMFDCPAPLLHEPVDGKTLLRWFLEDLALDLPITEWMAQLGDIADDPQQQISRVIALQSELYARTGTALLPDAIQLTAIYRVFVAIVQGSRRYRPTRVDADVLLVRAQSDVVSEFSGHPQADVADWGWRSWCRHIDTRRLPGTHYTLLSGQTVSDLAAITEQWLHRHAIEI